MVWCFWAVGFSGLGFGDLGVGRWVLMLVGRPCTLKDLRQLARAPFKYARMAQSNMMPDVLLCITLALPTAVPDGDPSSFAWSRAGR